MRSAKSLIHMAGRKETVSDAEILSIFADASDPFLTTNEVAGELEFSNAGARKRLYALVDEGYLDLKRVGRSPVWWLTDDGREFLESDVED
jgi:predicted ArsR family transcriptional regulator